MPTIIKPLSSKGKSSPIHIASHDFPVTKKPEPVLSRDSSDESFELPSLPMPTIPPPPPPCLVEEEIEDNTAEYSDESCSYAIVMFDFESDIVEDLNIKVS